MDGKRSLPGEAEVAFAGFGVLYFFKRRTGKNHGTDGTVYSEETVDEVLHILSSEFEESEGEPEFEAEAEPESETETETE